MEDEDAFRARLDQLLQLVAMSRLGGKERKDEEFRASLLQLISEHCESHICDSYIYGLVNSGQWAKVAISE